MSFSKHLKRGRDISRRDIPTLPYPWVFLQCYENNALQYNEETSSIHECTVELDARLKYTLTRISEGVNPSLFFQKVLGKKTRREEINHGGISGLNVEDIVRRFLEEEDLGVETTATVSDSVTPDITYQSAPNGLGAPFLLGPPELGVPFSGSSTALVEVPKGPVVTTPSYFRVLSSLHRRERGDAAQSVDSELRMEDDDDEDDLSPTELCACGCPAMRCEGLHANTEEQIFAALRSYRRQMRERHIPKPSSSAASTGSTAQQRSFSRFMRNGAPPALPQQSFDKANDIAFPLVVANGANQPLIDYSALSSLGEIGATFPLCLSRSDDSEDVSLGSMHGRYQYLLSDSARTEESEEGVYVFEPNAFENAVNDGYYSRFFKELRVLGRGAFGTVFLAEHVLDTVRLGQFAVKRIPVGVSSTRLIRAQAEVRAVEQLRHNNVIQYFHSWVEHAQVGSNRVLCVFILMEYCDMGDLTSIVQPHRLQLVHCPLSTIGDVWSSNAQWQGMQWRMKQKRCVEQLQPIGQCGQISPRGLFPLRYAQPGNTVVRSVHARNIMVTRVEEALAHQKPLLYAMHPCTVKPIKEDLAAHPWASNTLFMPQEHAEMQTPLLEESLVWTIFIEICCGLAHSHSRNQCHRDIKLENVMLRSSTRPVAMSRNLVIGAETYAHTGKCCVCSSDDDALYSASSQSGVCPACVRQLMSGEAPLDQVPIQYDTVQSLQQSVSDGGVASKISMVSNEYSKTHLPELAKQCQQTGGAPLVDPEDGLTSQERSLRAKLALRKQSAGAELPDSLAHIPWQFLEDVVLTDFGGASKFNEPHHSMGATGTMQYCAPEVLNRNAALLSSKEDLLAIYTSDPYNQIPVPSAATAVQDAAADVWALGVLLYALSFALLPFATDPAHSDVHGYYFCTAASIVHFPVFSHESTLVCPRSLALQHMIHFLLRPNPLSRPTIHEVISHPLMKLHDVRNKLHSAKPVGKSLVLTKQLASLVTE